MSWKLPGRRCVGRAERKTPCAHSFARSRFIPSPHACTHGAVATNSETVRLFELGSLSCTGSLSGHRGIVLCLDSALTPSGRPLLVTGAKDHEVRVWDVHNVHTCLAVGAGHVGAVSAVAISRRLRSEGKPPFAASAGADKLLKVRVFFLLRLVLPRLCSILLAGSRSCVPPDRFFLLLRF